MTKILFFDLETTGLFDNTLSYHFSEVDKFPRVVQLAYLLYDIKKNLIESGNQIIKPTDFIIPYDAVQVHGITNEIALKEGVSMIKALGDFFCTAFKADYFISHNLKFDYNILGAEATRLGFEKQYNDLFMHRNSLCTMKTTKELLKVKRGTGFKYPKLSELYKYLFQKPIQNHHNAIYDAKACSKCFFELYKQGFYKIKQYDFDAVCA